MIEEETSHPYKVKKTAEITTEEEVENVVAENNENVVADVVATRETTTDKKSSATTRKNYNWRIEINRRKRKGEGHTYHWMYRLTNESGKRRSKYGGSLTVLKAVRPERWKQYQENSKGGK